MAALRCAEPMKVQIGASLRAPSPESERSTASGSDSVPSLLDLEMQQPVFDAGDDLQQFAQQGIAGMGSDIAVYSTRLGAGADTSGEGPTEALPDAECDLWWWHVASAQGSQEWHLDKWPPALTLPVEFDSLHEVGTQKFSLEQSADWREDVKAVAPPPGLTRCGTSAIEGLPSAGSIGHFNGTCKPCAFFYEGCQNGEACSRCHLCPPGELKSRKKKKLASRRRMERTVRK